jgi:nicotinamide-nucleotide amidase
VSWESIKNHGAVSKQVVEEMVSGVRHKLGTDCAIATSGIAGPDGGIADKPVGTIWIAAATPNGVVSERFQFGTDREKNILRSSQTALHLLQKELLK